MTNSPHIRTFSGRLVNPLDLQPEDIIIEDIAHALSHQCRFTGHTRDFYSVAEHTLRGCNMLAVEHRKQFLLHDAAEAYLLDLPAPLKNNSELGTCFKDLEEKIKFSIYTKFGVPTEEHAEVQRIDKRMCEIEKASLMNGHEITNVSKNEIIFYTMLPGSAKKLFLKTFHALFDNVQVPLDA